MKVVGMIEARMGSMRLPGKTMMPVHNEVPLLGCVVARFRKCCNVDEVVVATSTEAKDDQIVEWCEKNGVTVSCGSENDVLNRVVCAAAAAKADLIVQMGADSAYLDYQLIDYLIEVYNANDVDYVCNDLELTYPLGVYGHVIGFETLYQIDRMPDVTAKQRADVVRYVWEHSDQYRILNVMATPEFAYPDLRLTIDYPADMALAQAVYSRFGGGEFVTSDLISLFKREPNLFNDTRNLHQESAPFIKA